jgi:hypothetical protein
VIWLSWRQFRTQAAALAAVVAACALVLVVHRPPNPALYDLLDRGHRALYLGGLFAVALAPAVVGAFWGAPMVARELEAGTHRLIWNQSVTRTRWLLTKLGVAALGAAAVVGLLALAVQRWAARLDGVLSDTHGALPDRLTPVAFAMRGIVPVGYAVFALLLGVTAGLLLRRTVPAMAVTLVAYLLVQLAVPLWVRPHLIPPERATVAITVANFDGLMTDGTTTRLTSRSLGRGDWMLSNRTVDPGGRVVDSLPTSVPACIPPVGPPAPGDRPLPLEDCLDGLAALGYQQQLVYQPASRFWPLQWAETGLFLALSGLLAAFCVWRVRRV